MTAIYESRGLDRLADQVAQQLMAHDALGAHARDDIGISSALTARPLQAAVASSISFAFGGVVPLFVAVGRAGRHSHSNGSGGLVDFPAGAWGRRGSRWRRADYHRRGTSARVGCVHYGGHVWCWCVVRLHRLRTHKIADCNRRGSGFLRTQSWRRERDSNPR